MKGFKGFKKRGPMALWKVLILVFVALIGIAGATALVLFLTGKFDEDHIEPEDMAFTHIVDGQGYADNVGDNTWYFLSDDSNVTISCTTENVTETKVKLTLRNGRSVDGNPDYITDGVIIIPSEVELNKAFKVELARVGGQIIGSTREDASGNRIYSYITAESQNIILPRKHAYVAVDTPVSSISLAVGNAEVAHADEVQNVVVGSRFQIDAIFNPTNSKYLFNNKNSSKKVYYTIFGNSGTNFISATQNADGSYTFSADVVSDDKYSTVYAYTFANSYFEKVYFDDHPDATTDEIVAFMQDEDNAYMVKSTRTFIKVLDIEVDKVLVEPSGEKWNPEDSLGEIYVDKYFTLSANNADKPNDMSLGISIFDSGKHEVPVLLGRVGVKVPKNQTNFSIVGGRVMKVTTVGDKVTIEEEAFDPTVDYSKAAANVEYYILPSTRSTGDYGNYYWSLASDTVTSKKFSLGVNFFFKNQEGVWTTFFDSASEKSFDVIVKEGNNSVSLTTDSLDLVINYDDAGKPIADDLLLTADIGDSVYTKVVYFLYDNTRDGGSVEIENVFDCSAGVEYKTDYKGKDININGIQFKSEYMFYELPASNILTAKKSYSGSVVVVAALVRTDANGNIQYQDEAKTRYQIVCFSNAKVVSVDSTLSISNMTPVFTFADKVEKYNNQYYLPAINQNKNIITFNLKLSSEDIAKDVEKLETAYKNKSLRLAVCDKDGNEYKDQYLSLSNFGELVDKRTANLAEFEGTITINEELFSAGKNAVDQGRLITLKIVYNDGKETREKAVGMDTPKAPTDKIGDAFYIYFQQPKEIRANYSSRSDISVSNSISVEISAGSAGLKINWGNVPLTGASYADTISQLNSLLTFTMYDQFGFEINPDNGVYSVYFQEIRKDSNTVLVFDETTGLPTSISDFSSTNGTVVSTGLQVYVVDRKNDNNRVFEVNADGTFSSTELQSDLITFEVSTEGLDYISFDKTDIVGNADDGRFADAEKGVSKVTVSKSVKSNDTISLSDLFRIYTTNSTAANTDYTIVFDGTWLQGFQGGNNDAALKKMFQINGEDSSSSHENITEYNNLSITTLKINAPFDDKVTLQFKINSNNNLYSASLDLVLSSDIQISRSFERYQTKYADYLTTTTGGPVSVFADEIYDLDEYLSFNSDKYSWADAFIGKGVDLSSNINGVFYENSGIASLDTVVSGKVRLQIASVRQYTPIEITLYYGVRSTYAFNVQIALYVNPNIVIVEKVDNLKEYPRLDLTNISTENISYYYGIYKATSYIDSGLEVPVSLGSGTSNLDIKTLTYVNKDQDGFISIQNGSTNAANAGKFAFVAGKTIDILNSYTQEFSVYASDDAVLDAVKVRVDAENNKEIIKYNSTNHVAIGFAVCYNSAGIDDLIENIFPGASSISYNGELRLLMLAGKEYQIDPTFSIAGSTGSYVKEDSKGKALNTRVPTFVNSDNTVSVYSDVTDGNNSLRIDLTLGVTVSNVGEEFVYYTNEDGKFNTFGDVDFDKLISSDFADLEENNIYESLGAGKSYKILHDISTDYSLTKDEVLDANKTYYQKLADSYVAVETPTAEQLSTYFEKNAPEQGFYYNSVLISANGGGKKEVSAEIVETGVNGYISNLATYEGGVLTINSMESDLSGYIVLRINIKTTGANVETYSWYYRIKVLPNFEIGKVNYPYNETTDEIFGEYLDTKSEYYNRDNLTYSIDLGERFSSSNSSRNNGTRFDEIKWMTKPEGIITEEYRTKYVSSNAVTISYDGATINIAYANESYVGSAQTVVIEKCWKVNGVEIVGSAMEYTFKLNQTRQYSIEIYRDEVSNSLVADENGNYSESIVAGSGEQVFIPNIRTNDGGVYGEMEDFGASLKGNKLDLLDALKFKKVWLAAGTEIKTSATDSIILDHDAVLVDKAEWTYADVEIREEAGNRKTFVVYNGTELKELEYKEDGYLWGDISASAINGAEGYITCGVKLEDLIVEFLAEGKLEYKKTTDKTVNRNKKYYTFVDGKYVEATFASGATFEDGVTYFEKEKVPYKTIILNPKENISKDSSFELGVYTKEGVVVKVSLDVESYFAWDDPQTSVESGKIYTFGDLIANLASKDPNREIVEVSLRLNNASDNYREYYYITDDKERVVGEEYFVLEGGEYKKVEFEQDQGFDAKKTYYECVSLKISDVLELTGSVTQNDEGNLNFDGLKLEIAPLVEDIDLDFDVVIRSTQKASDSEGAALYADEESVYTFALPLTVTATFNEKENRTVQDLNWRYGQISFEALIEEGDAVSTITPSDVVENAKPTTVGLASTTNTTYKFVAGDGYELVDATETGKAVKVQITPENVGEEEQGLVKSLNVIGRFKGKEISRFVVSYRYSVAKNVIVKANYPTPDGIETTPEGENNSSTTEYISATTANGTESQRVSKDYNNFFNTSATFAMKTEDGYKKRIEVSSARRVGKDDYVETTTDIKKHWDISISNISNLRVDFSEGELDGADVKSITSETTDKVILQDSEDGRINLRFTILNTGARGTVTFDVKVNKVLTQYTVTVINDSIIRVSTNTPNYNLNRETVFAEDLAKSEELTLFAESRLLNFIFKSSAVSGANYFVRLTNRTNVAETKIVPITVSNRGVAINIDLGKSYADFDYTATFRTLEGAQNNDSGSKILDDSELFTVSPNLTSRIIVEYYDGKSIKLDGTNYIKLGSEIGWKVEGISTKPTSYTADDPDNKILGLYNPNSANVMNESGAIVTFKSETNGAENTFYKINTGDAFVGYFSGLKNIPNGKNASTKYSGVILLSKERSAITVGINTTNITGTETGEEISIAGETWYITTCDGRNFVEGTLEDVSELGKAIKLSGETWKDCVSDLVRQSFFGYKKSDDIRLTTADYHKTRNFSITLQVGNETIYTDWQYNLYLDIEFGVSQTADSSTTYSMREIDAGDELSLFDQVDFGIYNTRTGNKYSRSGRAGTDNLKDSAGIVTLQYYGFSDLPIINNGDELQKAAWEIHRNLMDTTGKDLSKDIIYSTGLKPRAGSFTLNGDAGSSAQNYITQSGLQRDMDGNDTGKNLDFSIYAHGANNDGNHVMMRITYTVTFGDSEEPISISHNLLFKVRPNANISFLVRQSSTARTSSADLLVNGKTYASNKESPFMITNNDSSETEDLGANKFYLWKKDVLNESAVVAYLYGNTTLNNANTFTYTYSFNSSTSEYNNFYQYSTPVQIMLSDEEDGKLVSLVALKLGTRKFYIDAVDSFGFNIRFYFTLTATENPQIARIVSNDGVLKEGQAVVVGAQFLPVAPPVVTAEVEAETEVRQLLGSFTYQKKGNGSGDTIADVLSNLPSGATKIVLSAQTTTGFGTVERSVTPSNGKINIWGKADEWAGSNGACPPVVQVENEHYNDTNFDDWQNRYKEIPLEQSGDYGLEGAEISVYAVFPNGKDFTTHTNIKYEEANGKNEATGNYEDKIIEQPYSTSSGYEEPSVQVGTEANLDKAKVILRGISAYGFKASGEDSIHSLNTDVAVDFKSRVNDIKVSKIEYFKNDVLIGVSKRGTSTPSGDVSLITSDDYKFYDGKSTTPVYEQATSYDASTTYYSRSDGGVYTVVSSSSVNNSNYGNYFVATDKTQPYVNGVGYQNKAFDFLVPVIDSIYFERNDSIGQVRMDITLIESSGGRTNTCVLSEYVTISRLASYDGFEGKTNIMDNTSVANPNIVGQKLYNDTLEVVLDPGESVQFAISDKPFTEVPTSDLVNPEPNTTDYTVTRYVGISANIKNLDYNYKSLHKTGDKFYITVVSQTTSDEIEFFYNGSKVQVAVVDGNTSTVPKYVYSTDSMIVKGKTYYERSSTGTYTAYTGDEFYKQATAPYTSGKTYYEYVEDTDLYVVTTNVDANQITKYFEQNDERFYHREKADLNSGKTYYTYSAETYSYEVVANPVKDTEYFVSTDRYELSYKRTSDRELDRSKTYYTVSETGVYTAVEAKDLTVNKIAQYYEQETSTLYAEQTISLYNSNITLHINDAQELSGKKSTTETLYFLYQGQNNNIEGVSGFTNTNMYYQMSKAFSVFPQYEKMLPVTATDVDAKGNIQFSVDGYLKASRSGVNDFYYIIPREVWGEKLKLAGYSEIANSLATFRSGSSYKYVFEINNDVEGGAGSAFIDESGNIITDKNFNLQYSTISVNVYMKVSGQNGFFDVDSTRLKLGSFRMFLNAQNESNKKNISIPEGRYGRLTTKGYASGVIAVPRGYDLSIYSDNTSNSLSTITNTPFGSARQTIACEAGDTLNFAELFEEEAQGKHNLVYHIVEDEIGGVSNIIHYNNLNTYKIEGEGTHTLTILVGYRTSKTSEMTYGVVKLDVMAYNVLNRKDNVIMLYASEYKKTTDESVVEGKDYFTLTEGGDYVKVESPVDEDLGKYYDIDGSTYELGSGPWYAFDEDGAVKLITNSTSNKAYYTAPVQTGIYNESFVSLDDGVTKVNSFTFYVVSRDDSEERNVVLNQNAPYNLANLFETSGYRFYKVNGNFTHGSDHTALSDAISEISTENFSIGANTTIDVHYIVRNSNGKYFQLTVHYKFTTSNSPTSATVFIKEGEKLTDAVSRQVEADLKDDKVTIQSIELIGRNGLLSSDLQIAGKDAEGKDTTDIRIDSKDYVITYTVEGSDKPRYVRYSVAFYVYKDTAELTVETQTTTSYRLIMAGGDILKKLNLPENAAVTFWQLNDSGKLDVATEISLATLNSENVEKTYIVVIEYNTDGEGETKVKHTDYYLIDLIFTLAKNA